MPSDQEQLTLIRTQTLAVIAAITAAPKPSYQIDGQAVMWAAYLDQLRRTVEWCDEKLSGYEPFEIESKGQQVSFDPAGDYATFDGQTTVELWQPDAAEALIVAGAVRGPVEQREAAPTGGEVRQADTVWHLPVAELAVRPRLGGLIVDSGGTSWTVLAVDLQTVGTRWRCTTRELSIDGADALIDLQRPDWEQDACGAPAPTFVTYATSVAARVTQIEEHASADHNERAGTPTVRVHLGVRLAVQVDDRVLHGGRAWRVVRVDGLDRIDRLPELELEEVR